MQSSIAVDTHNGCLTMHAHTRPLTTIIVFAVVVVRAKDGDTMGRKNVNILTRSKRLKRLFLGLACCCRYRHRCLSVHGPISLLVCIIIIIVVITSTAFAATVGRDAMFA